MSDLRQCECGATPVLYANPPELGVAVRCTACWAETEWMPTEAEAVAEWDADRWEYQEPIGGCVFINQLEQRR